MLIFLWVLVEVQKSLAASALDSFNCNFQGRFLFKSEKEKSRAINMGIKNLNKKYELNEIVSGDSILCHWDYIWWSCHGIKIENDEFISETLITHKSSGLRKIKIKQKI